MISPSWTTRIWSAFTMVDNLRKIEKQNIRVGRKIFLLLFLLLGILCYLCFSLYRRNHHQWKREDICLLKPLKTVIELHFDTARKYRIADHNWRQSKDSYSPKCYLRGWERALRFQCSSSHLPPTEERKIWITLGYPEYLPNASRLQNERENHYTNEGNHFIGELQATFFLSRTKTRSRLFSDVTGLHTSAFILLSIFSLVETISLKS